MKLDVTLRFKVFLVGVCFIVLGQTVYSHRNIQSFQQSYIDTLEEKCLRLGTLLKNDVEYVLSLNIPITKLTKMESTLSEIMETFPELRRIEITGQDMKVLYYSDRREENRSEGSVEGAGGGENRACEARNLPGGDERADTVLPIYHTSTEEEPVGFIRMQLAPEIIAKKSREILLDMITMILTSLLITFEFLTFFARYSMSDPLEDVIRSIRASRESGRPVPAKRYLLMGGLEKVTVSFNGFLERFAKTRAPLWGFQDRVEEHRGVLVPALEKQGEAIHFLLTPADPSSAWLKPSVLDRTLREMRSVMETLRSQWLLMERLLPLKLFPSARTAAAEATVESAAALTESPIPFTYVRPVIFLFVMAEGFTISFIPMYVDMLYQPFLGLSRQVVLGLPISIYMLFFALSMPVTGSWSDRVGWCKPLMIGIAVNTIGLVLTALARDIPQLLLFRAVTAVGCGMVYLACQQLVVDNTTTQNRTMGMAAFLAAFFSGDICGTVVGGMLADRIGYRNVFLMSSLVSLLAFACAFLLFRKEFGRHKDKEARAAFPVRDLFRVIRDREFFAVTFFQAIPAKIALIGFLYYFVPLYLKHLRTLQSDIARVIMCYGVVLVFLGPLVSKIFRNERRRKHYILAGGVITGLSLMSFHFISGFFPTCFLVVALGVAHTFSVSAQASYIAETPILREMGAGTGMGLFRFWERVGNVTGPVLVGSLISLGGYEKSVVTLGAISLVCSLLYLLFACCLDRTRMDTDGDE